MSYCPECRDQFEDWVKKCPDCHTALVGKLPEPKTESSTREKASNAPLAHLATAPNEGIALMWSDILNENDIHSLVKSAAMNIYVQTFGSPYELYVLESDVGRARQTLAPFLERD